MRAAVQEGMSLDDAFRFEQPNGAVHGGQRHTIIQLRHPPMQLRHVRVVVCVRKHLGNEPSRTRETKPASSTFGLDVMEHCSFLIGFRSCSSCNSFATGTFSKCERFACSAGEASATR